MEDRNSVQSSGVKFDCSLRHVGIDGAPLVMDGKCKLLPCLVCQFILLQTLDRNAVGPLRGSTALFSPWKMRSARRTANMYLALFMLHE